MIFMWYHMYHVYYILYHMSHVYHVSRAYHVIYSVLVWYGLYINHIINHTIPIYSNIPYSNSVYPISKVWFRASGSFTELLYISSKVLLLLRFFQGITKDPYDLALVRWYDIDQREPELYGCPQLYYTKEYNTIPIGSINQVAHIVPRFDKNNRFLLNKYIF